MECYIYCESLKSTIKQILTKLFIKKRITRFLLMNQLIFQYFFQILNQCALLELLPQPKSLYTYKLRGEQLKQNLRFGLFLGRLAVLKKLPNVLLDTF